MPRKSPQNQPDEVPAGSPSGAATPSLEAYVEAEARKEGHELLSWQRAALQAVDRDLLLHINGGARSGKSWLLGHIKHYFAVRSVDHEGQ